MEHDRGKREDDLAEFQVLATHDMLWIDSQMALWRYSRWSILAFNQDFDRKVKWVYGSKGMLSRLRCRILAGLIFPTFDTIIIINKNKEQMEKPVLALPHHQSYFGNANSFLINHQSHRINSPPPIITRPVNNLNFSYLPS